MLLGRVSDQSGKSIVGAQVRILDIQRRIRIVTQTNKSGFYRFPGLKPSQYRIEVSAFGFKSASTAVTLLVQDDAQQDFTMSSGMSDPPVIGGAGTPIETTGAVSTVIDQTLVNELPLNGRSFQTLFQLTSGVVITATSFANQGQFSVNGQRTNANNFIVDGVSANLGIAAGVNLGQTADGSLPALTAFGATTSLVSTDDVQEFAILSSSYTAELGRMPGAQVSIVTRSGTNEFHGELFNYLRNDALDANDWFANNARSPRAALRQNDFGAVVGGPIRKDNVFFFSSYEGVRLTQPQFQIADVPSIAARNEAPAAIRPFLNAYPLPNGPDDGNGLAQANYEFSNPSTLNAASIRVDQQVGPGASWFARYSFSRSGRQQRAADANSLSTVTTADFGVQAFTAGMNFRLSERLGGDLRFNWGGSGAERNDKLDGFGGAIPFQTSLVFPAQFGETNSLFQLFPTVNTHTSGLSLGRDVRNEQTQFNYVTNLSYQMNNHLPKFGLNIRSVVPNSQAPAFTQQIIFSNIQAALNLQTTFGVVASAVRVESKFKSYSAYAEDEWKITNHFTFNYGLRWEYNPTPQGHGDGGRHSIVLEDVASHKFGIAPAGTPVYRSTWDNFAPRLGLAYQISHRQAADVVLVAGIGKFYDLGTGTAGNLFDGTTSPFSAQRVFLNVPFPLTLAELTPPQSVLNSPLNVVAFPKVVKTPYTWEWNIGLRQSLGSGNSLSAEYIGSIGRKLLRAGQFVGGEAGVPAGFTQIAFTDNSGFSDYNAFQLRFVSRSFFTMHLIASYSYSHSLDNVSSDSTLAAIPSGLLDPRADYGSSDFDLRHDASIGVNYDPKSRFNSRIFNDLLANWSVDAILVFYSSPPVNVTVLRDIGFGTYDFRPDLVKGEPLYFRDRNAPGGKRLNPSSVMVPAEQRQGTLARNYFRGFPLSQIDSAVQRKIPISERAQLVARIEIFNVLNHPNFSPESGFMGAIDASGHLIQQSGFGVSQSTLAQGFSGQSVGGIGSGFSALYQLGGPRAIQVSLKIVL